MEGWLLKKMPRPADRDKRNRVKRLVANALRGGDQFQRRYVVLDGAAGELAYYRDDDESRRGAELHAEAGPRDAVALGDLTVTNMSMQARDVENGLAPLEALDVGKPFVLCTLSDECR